MVTIVLFESLSSKGVRIRANAGLPFIVSPSRTLAKAGDQKTTKKHPRYSLRTP